MEEDIFNLNREKITGVVTDALHKSSGGELFLECSQTEMLTLENGILRNSDFSIRKGFGLRSFSGEQTTFYHSFDIGEDSIIKAAKMIENSDKQAHHSVSLDGGSWRNEKLIYPAINPIDEVTYENKLSLIKEIEEYLHKKSSNIKQSMVTISAKTQIVEIIKKSGEIVRDIRPLVRLNILVVLERDGRAEQGYCGVGGRGSYGDYWKDWKSLADEALRQAQVNLEAVPAPAGAMTVVLGNGWPGVLLHEAIGHGLEGDFNRKKTSVFSELMGKRVASEGIVVVDDGTIENARGSINVDDEGNASGYNVLIDDGILTGYMHDCLNASLMNTTSTGNGRRESYAHGVLPRMTNTYMLPGKHAPEEVIESVDKGLYAVNFGGGQVDITSGKFVFLASEAYMIENGKVTHPVKGATIIGNGPDILTKISMVGNDLKLDPGVGTCSKDGQNLPVGVGQPTLKIDSIIVGGTSPESSKGD